MKKLILLLFCCATILCVDAQQRMPRDIEQALNKLNIAEIAIKSLYVDTVNINDLTAEAIKGMLSKLDPHSSYTTAEETRKLNEPLNGNFEGIGVQFNILEDTLIVIQTISKGPSEKVGILAGDRIITVDGEAIAGVKMDRADIMKKLRGPKGTKTRLGIVRRGVSETLYFDVVRDKIPLFSVDAAYMVRPGVGLIRVSSFAATTAKEVEEAIIKLKKQGMKDLIFDLTENGGGYLQAATDVASLFLPKGDMIVYTDGRSVQHSDYYSKGSNVFQDGKLVILVDGFTAPAAEIVSGAVQDQDRGIIVGRRTFGKGLVQRPIDLPDGSLIRLTVSHYYTPSGRCIQRPYKKGEKKEYDEDILQRLRVGELMHADSIHFSDSLKYSTLRKGRTVYGGGGIMPDYFVPLDTNTYTPYYRRLSNRNIILTQYMKYYDRVRQELQGRYKKFDKFSKEYEVPSELLATIEEEGKKVGITPSTPNDLELTLVRLKQTLKGLAARDLWDMSEYFNVIYEDNPMVIKALELLSK